METAQKWALKSVPIFDSSEVISALIDKGDDLLSDVAFCTYWFLEELFYMACRIDNDDSINLGNAYKQRCFEVVSKIFETVYQNDDTYAVCLHKLPFTNCCLMTLYAKVKTTATKSKK